MPSYAITGASRGLGLEFVRQLSQDPSNIIFALVRNPSGASKLQELAKANSQVHILKADIENPEELSAAASTVSKITDGKLDVLIHNASAVDPSTIILTPSQLPSHKESLHAAFELALSTNVFGTILVTNAFLPLIEKGSEKKIVDISTGMADMGLIKAGNIPNFVAYAVAKGAMNVLVAKYASELRPKGIKVLAMSPGWVDTYEGPVPKPAELVAVTQSLLQTFQKVLPSLQGQISKEESVRDQLDVIQNKLDLGLSGEFVSQHGNNKDWF